ncbi:MAG: hypothetical protein AAF990_02600 [Bacteroidota bacterium]
MARITFFIFLCTSLMLFFNACTQEEPKSTTPAQSTTSKAATTPVPETPNMGEEFLVKMVDQAMREEIKPIERQLMQASYEKLNDSDVVDYNRLLRKAKYLRRVELTLSEEKDTAGLWQQYLDMEVMSQELHDRSMIMYERPYFRLNSDQRQDVMMKYNDNIRSLRKQQ